jgi:hypothetical protein
MPADAVFALVPPFDLRRLGRTPGLSGIAATFIGGTMLAISASEGTTPLGGMARS